MTALRRQIVMLVALTAAGCAELAPPAPAPQPSPIAAELLAAHNDERVYHHVRPLRFDSELTRQAQEHARWMADSGRFQHSRNGAENIAWNYPNVAAVMHGWMTSPGHRANILGQRYTRFGGGMARDRNGSPYWCARFE